MAHDGAFVLKARSCLAGRPISRRTPEGPVVLCLMSSARPMVDVDRRGSTPGTLFVAGGVIEDAPSFSGHYEALRPHREYVLTSLLEQGVPMSMMSNVKWSKNRPLFWVLGGAFHRQSASADDGVPWGTSKHFKVRNRQGRPATGRCRRCGCASFTARLRLSVRAAIGGQGTGACSRRT